MENTPCKMSFEHWGEKITLKKPNSDIDMEEFWEMCKNLAKAAGYHQDHIDKYFNE
jgi:hypothetical protein